MYGFLVEIAKMNTFPIIRKAIFGDALQLSLLAESTFRATFEQANTVENMEHFCKNNYSEKIQEEEIANKNMLTFLCDDNGSLIGFAQLRWGDAPKYVEARNAIEIQRLYVADNWHGKGIAQQIMHSCIEEIQNRESDVVWLGVWEHNPRAIAFYKKFGFTEVGEHVFTVGDDPQRDIIMARTFFTTQ